MRFFSKSAQAIIVLLVAGMFFGCGGSNSYRKPKVAGQRLIEIDNELESIYQSLAMQDSILLNQNNFDQLKYSNSELREDLSDISDRIHSLETKMDSTDFDILSQVVILENKLATLKHSYQELISFQGTTAKPEQQKITYEEYKSRYKETLALYQNGNYSEAITKFNELIAVDANNDLSDNCQYWIAECFYAQKDYKRSIMELEKVFSFAGTNKADAAQFKIGLCYLNIGDVVHSKAAFQRLVDFYPNSESASKAKQYLLKF